MTSPAKTSDLRTLVGRVLANGSASALGYGSLLLSLTVLARLLGPEEYGRYVLAFTWLTVLTLLANGGGDQALLRFVAAYRVRRDWAHLHGVLRWAQRRAWRLASAFAAVAATAALLSGERLTPQTRWTFLLACLAIPLTCQGQIRQYSLRALHRFVYGIFPQQILQPLLLTAVVATLYGAGLALNAPLAMAVNLGGALLALGILVRLQRRHLPPATLATVPREEPAQWHRTALPLMLASGMHLALVHTDTLMLGLLTDNTETGVYNAASRLSGVMAFGLLTANTVLAPMFSELFAAGRPERLQRLVSLAALGTTLALVPVTLVMVLGGKWLLGLFGPAFVAGYLPLLILSAGQLVNAAAGSVDYLLTMSGHQAEMSRVLVLAALLNLAGNALLIPHYGALGAAASTGGAIALWNLVLVWRVRRRTGIHPTALSWRFIARPHGSDPGA